jgi:hypothetical protein
MMGTVTIIVLGVVAITVVSVLGDMVSKVAQARAKARAASGGLPSAEIERLSGRLALLEARVEERDESIRKLQDELRFVSRMLEDRSGGGSGK